MFDENHNSKKVQFAMSDLFDLEIYNSGHENYQLEEMVCGRLILGKSFTFH